MDLEASFDCSALFFFFWRSSSSNSIELGIASFLLVLQEEEALVPFDYEDRLEDDLDLVDEVFDFLVLPGVFSEYTVVTWVESPEEEASEYFAE